MDFNREDLNGNVVTDTTCDVLGSQIPLPSAATATTASETIVHKGYLTLVRPGSNRKQQELLVKVYRTSKGRMAALWKDDRESKPLGCLFLRDTTVTRTENRPVFCVRPKACHDYDANSSLTFVCNNENELNKWIGAFSENHSSTCTTGRRRTAYIERMPSVTEEESD